VLRRGAAEGQGPSLAAGAQVPFEGFTLDLVRRRLRAPDGALVVLSTNEFTLLSILLRHAGQALSRETLAGMGTVEPTADVDRAVDMLVSRLRRKLRAHAAEDLIATERGRGYRLTAVVDEPGRLLLASFGRGTVSS
jgi:two-component system OmpR family response regulator